MNRGQQMLPNESQIAFKEWAVTVDALAQGQQVLLLRKGGIHEVTKDFRVAHPEFLLYPTYEHQKEDLLKPASQHLLRQTLMQPRAPDTVTFSYWAQVTETIKVAEPQKVQELSKYHIWTNEYTDSRLRWKPMVPLSIMLLRVYELESPITIPWIKEYSGCTSWVEIMPKVGLGHLKPAMNDIEYQRHISDIKSCLGLNAAGDQPQNCGI